MANPVGHVTYLPPTENQAFDSAQHIGMALLGQEPKDKEFLWHGMTVVSFGVAKGLKIDDAEPMFSGPGGVEEEAKKVFGPLASGNKSFSAQEVSAFPWAIAFQLAFQLITEFLKRR